MNKTFYGILTLLLVAIGAAAYYLSGVEPRFSFPVLMGGNVLLFILSAVSFALVSKTFAERPQAFVRGVFSGTLIRLFACVGGVLVYALANRGHLYKPVIFALMGMYALYSIVENILLSRMAKAK